MKIGKDIILGFLISLLGILMFVFVLINGWPYWFTINQMWTYLSISGTLTGVGVSMPIIFILSKSC